MLILYKSIEKRERKTNLKISKLKEAKGVWKLWKCSYLSKIKEKKEKKKTQRNLEKKITEEQSWLWEANVCFGHCNEQFSMCYIYTTKLRINFWVL